MLIYVYYRGRVIYSCVWSSKVSFPFILECSRCQMRSAQGSVQSPGLNQSLTPEEAAKLRPGVPLEHATAIWVRDGTGQYSLQEKTERVVDEHPEHGPFWSCSWCEQHDTKLWIVFHPFLSGEKSEQDNATAKSGTGRQVQKIIPSQQVRLLHQSLLAGWAIRHGPWEESGVSPVGVTRDRQGHQGHQGPPDRWLPYTSTRICSSQWSFRPLWWLDHDLHWILVADAVLQMCQNEVTWNLM